MSLVERVAEAMAKAAIGPDEWEGLVSDTYRVMAQVALETLGLVTCQTCGGSTIARRSNGFMGRCPDCRRLGVVASEVMIERTARTSFDSFTEQMGFENEWDHVGESIKDIWRAVARAALLGAFGGDE